MPKDNLLSYLLAFNRGKLKLSRFYYDDLTLIFISRLHITYVNRH